MPLSLLIIGMANGQELDAASLNAILPEGFTPVCEEGQEPNPFGTYHITLHKYEVCAQRNVPAKRFKICYILCIRKPML